MLAMHLPAKTIARTRARPLSQIRPRTRFKIHQRTTKTEQASRNLSIPSMFFALTQATRIIDDLLREESDILCRSFYGKHTYITLPFDKESLYWVNMNDSLRSFCLRFMSELEYHGGEVVHIGMVVLETTAQLSFLYSSIRFIFKFEMDHRFWCLSNICVKNTNQRTEISISIPKHVYLKGLPKYDVFISKYNDY